MSIGIGAVIDVVASHARSTGFWPVVLTHEPKTAPSGPAAAIFMTSVVPYRERSGLISVSVVVTLTVRMYSAMLQEPQDNIDRDLVVASDALMTAYSGDFNLGDSSREIDLLGMAPGSPGAALTMGYINQDSKLFRIAEIRLPIIVNDVWTEAA